MKESSRKKANLIQINALLKEELQDSKRQNAMVTLSTYELVPVSSGANAYNGMAVDDTRPGHLQTFSNSEGRDNALKTVSIDGCKRRTRRSTNDKDQ
ncbi:hypothetical protein N7495_003049 [Penicillium taxi]|uniref:uncharacterized protein n=1 Tax=Penicillium taxi TaxID=168475 RepID=UPI002545A56C|nr:uncharacterized protein N7495_003049 [Penicillium taxi]KAJ5902521.1 hypothetical protein N7495_003049 [Penicillium taxi]